MEFLPTGFPYGGTPLGGGGQMYQPQGQPNTQNMDPQQYLEWLTAIGNSPQGQQAQAAMQQTIAMNVRQALAAMQNERDRIAIARGQAEADRWYREESLKLAQQAHQLAVQGQQQNYGLAVGGLTGMFNGQPTLAAQNQAQQYALQQAQLALSQLTQQQQHELAQGTLNLATLTQQQRNVIEQAQLGLTQAGITGEFNGRPTLAALAQQQQFGLSQAGVTGTYGGSPTEAARQFNASLALQAGQQSGYGPNGAPTLAREQAAASTALQAGQLGASLRGPGDWAQFLQAQNAVAGSPASALVASAPGGLGMAAGDGGGPMTLSKLLTGFGVMPGQGAGGPGMTPGAGLAPHGAPIVGGQAPNPGAQTPESGWYGPGGTGVPGMGGGGAAPLTSQEQARFQQIMTRNAQLRAAGEPLGDLDELARYRARGASDASFDPGMMAPHGPIDQAGAPIGGGQGMQPWNLGYYGAPGYGGGYGGGGQGTPYGGGTAGGYMVRNPDGSWGQGGGELPGHGFPDQPLYASGGGGGLPGHGFPDQQMYAGGSPTFNERTGSYSSAPAGGMRRTMTSPVMGGFPNVDPATGGSTLTGMSMGNAMGGGGQGWNPYSPTGAIGQAAQPWQPTSQQLGFSNDDEMNTVKGYLTNPNTAPSTWWTSKSTDQKKYLGGLNQFWGGSNDTFLERERNARPRQQAWNAAV